MSALGQPLPHESAYEHIRGTASYVDDLPTTVGELFVDFAGSSVAHGRIISIDAEAAKQLDGVVAVLTARDVPVNNFGPVIHDEELLADQLVHFVGQPIVAIAATSRSIAAKAQKLVTVQFEALPAELTIEDAIAAEKYIGPERRIQCGDVAAALAQSKHRLTGDFHIGGQEHFYLESQAALAIPAEAGQIVVHSSTQNPTEIQAIVARVLDRKMAQVACICRRMGGGFGGKETQAALPAALAALVAAKTGRPARCVYGHEQDFRTTGKRHPYLVRYEVGFDDDGRINGYRAAFFSNGGFSADLSLAVMERTLLHAENAYFIPNAEFSGRVCRTNLPSNTAFRGFGGPQAVAAIENVIEEIAAVLRCDSLQVRRINCYGPQSNNRAPYGQIISNNTLPELIDRLAESSEYSTRRQAIAQFNHQSRTHLKGIALTPVKFGISFTRRTLNQANALVHVFVDGTIQVSTGGTEMGQGLNTKIRQLVADQFGVSVDSVCCLPTSTERNHNTSPTAASAGTDLNGTAAVRACESIKQRLAQVAAKQFARDSLEPAPEYVEFTNGVCFDRRDPTRTVPFAKLAAAAYEQRVDLGARGFYATPGVDFNRETGQGTPFFYYTNGAAVSEVLIDRFLGDVRVVRVDILLDLGRMINPAIDRGQTIGGFVQGMGWVTTEALVVSERGELLSDSATTYKIPNVTDVPADLRVDFLDNPTNRENVYSSKAVGEPPLLLAVSIWAAIKQAIAAGASGKSPKLNLPATGEEILQRLTEVANAGEHLSVQRNGVRLAMPRPARV